MEGTAGHVIGTTPLERDKVAHDVNYLGGVQNKAYCLLGDRRSGRDFAQELDPGKSDLHLLAIRFKRGDGVLEGV